MYTYCRLNCGKIMVLHYNDVDGRVVYLFDLEDRAKFDKGGVESIELEEYSYAETARIDLDLEPIEEHRISASTFMLH